MYGFLLAADERSALLQALISAPSCQLPNNCLHKKSGIFLCKYTVLLWNESSLFLFSLLKSFFFPSWRMCCSFPWNEACTKPSFFLCFFGSYSFKKGCSGDWGAALKVLLPFPLETTSSPCSGGFFFKAFCWQGMQKILNLLNSDFSVLSSVVSPEGGSTVCAPQPVPGCFSLGMKVWVWIPGKLYPNPPG